MNISEANGFVAPTLGDIVNGNYPIPDPGGSDSGWVVQSIGPGLKVYLFPNGEEVITDETGNILG